MVGMTNGNWTDIPADVAAERAAIEAEIAGSTLLTAYAQTVAENPDVVAHQWLADGQWRSLTPLCPARLRCGGPKHHLCRSRL